MEKYSKSNKRTSVEAKYVDEVVTEEAVAVEPVAKKPTTTKFDKVNFQTPKNVVKKMLGAVKLKPNDILMNACAGKGSILEEFPPNNPYLAVESNPNNCRILKNHGFSVECLDFLEYNDRKAHVIFIVPPLGNSELLLISKAWETIYDGGTVVALFSQELESSFPEWLILNSKIYPITDKFFSDNNLHVKMLVAKRG